MKTKLFIGLLLLSASFTACDLEREREISIPSIEPLEANDFADLEAEDTQIEVFDQIRPSGSISYGLNRLDVYEPDQKRTQKYLEEEIASFYEVYTPEFEKLDNPPAQNHVNPGILAQKEKELANGRLLRSSSACDSNDCQNTVRLEISRLQKIARENCLSMVASFTCCQNGQPKEIMVYLTPGVQCERATSSDNKTIAKTTDNQ